MQMKFLGLMSDLPQQLQHHVFYAYLLVIAPAKTAFTGYCEQSKPAWCLMFQHMVPAATKDVGICHAAHDGECSGQESSTAPATFGLWNS